MKSKREKTRVILLAGAILIISTGMLFTTVGAAQVAETNKIYAEQCQISEPVPSPISTTISEPAPSEDVYIEPSKAPANIESVQVSEKAVPKPSESIKSNIGPVTNSMKLVTPGPECISEDAAISIFYKAASDIFGITEKNPVTATFNSDTHRIWNVTDGKGECSIDAISGQIIGFSLSGDYSGKKITLGDYESGKTSSESRTASVPADINNSPNNIYINAAKTLVNDKLAGGRVIDNIEISATQFVWDNRNGGEDPSETGTIQVDCIVYMQTGYCYSLSFWGTESPQIRIFNSYPTKDACKWGYFYEEDAQIDNPLPSASASWVVVPEVTAGPTQ